MEEEDEAGDRRKGGQTGIPTPGEDAFTGPSPSRVSDTRNRRKHGQWFGVLFYRRMGQRQKVTRESEAIGIHSREAIGT